MRHNALVYLTEGYDEYHREQLLNGEDTPHPVHEEPFLRYHIAGAHSRDKEVNDLEKALANVNELCHQQRNKIYELRHPWISVEKRLPKFVEENNYNKLSDTKFVRVRNNQTGETRIDTAEYFQSKETKRCWWSIHELWWDETVTDWMDAPK